MFSAKKLFTFINSLELKKEGNRNKLKINIRNNGERFIATVSTKSKKNINFPRDVNDTKQIMEIIRQITSESIFDEIPDHVADEKATEETAKKPYEELPENYGDAIFPATVRPNIKAIKSWVINVKLSGMSDEQMLIELYGDSTDKPLDKSSKTFENLVDRIAYKISRKIWYVGRRPSNMTDAEWNEKTKYMRPQEGSYGQNDKWVNFKYDENYEYISGVIE